MTSIKQGYTPERNPTEKHKVASPNSASNLSSRDRDDFQEAFQPLNCLAEQQKSKSFKEMIHAIPKDTINSSDSSKDLTLEYQSLHNPDLYFDTLNLPRESKKLYIWKKSFTSHSFDYSIRTQSFGNIEKLIDLKYQSLGEKLKPCITLSKLGILFLNNGFQEPIVISCDLQSGEAYIT